jgi:energy-coupling factor transporter ATP-binding protein EcfA2
MTTSSTLMLPLPLQNPFLRYLHLGWSVIPLQAHGKLPEPTLLPVIPEGEEGSAKRSWKPYQTALATEAEALAWWRHEGINVGIVTGTVSGIVVLDLDNATAIRVAYERGIPQTPRASTGKGLHIYFRAPARRVGNRAGFDPTVEGFDFRGEGGYVVAPPSIHPNGSVYTWLQPPEDCAVAEMPEWLGELLLPSSAKPTDTPTLATDTSEQPAPLSDSERTIVAATIQAELEQMHRTRRGGRNDQLNRSAFVLGQLVGAGLADEREIEHRLETVALTTGLTPREVRTTMASGLRAGKRKPRSPFDPPEPQDTAPPDERTKRPKRESQAETMIRLGKEATLFHSPQQECYARFALGNRYETHPIGHPRSPFGLWLQRQFYLERGTPAALYSVQQALTHLEQLALFEGERHNVFTRLGYVEDTVYLALGDLAGNVVEIDRTGWRLVQDVPVLFRSTRNAEALPIPERGGSLEALRPFLNLANEEAWKLCIGWLIGTLNPRGPYAHLFLLGEQGSGKSSLLRLLRTFVDPAYAAENAEPKTVDDLMVTAVNSHILSYDNLSGINSDFTDWLCRLSTGAGLIRRKLYSDETEVVLKAARPVILNGIVPVVTRPDLLERTILVELPRIDSAQRMSERRFTGDLAPIIPGVVGALLDAVVVALQRLDTVYLPHLPRMADFTLWVEAAAPALGWEAGAFVAAYKANTATKEEQILEGDEVAETMLAWARYKLPPVGHEHSMTMKQLLAELTALRMAGNDPTHIARVSPTTRTPPEWPDSARALQIRLASAKPLLRQLGVDYDRGARKEHGQLYNIRRIARQEEEPPPDTP